MKFSSNDLGTVGYKDCFWNKLRLQEKNLKRKKKKIVRPLIIQNGEDTSLH